MECRRGKVGEQEGAAGGGGGGTISAFTRPSWRIRFAGYDVQNDR